jgi:hypothetical protein
MGELQHNPIKGGEDPFFPQKIRMDTPITKHPNATQGLSRSPELNIK